MQCNTYFGMKYVHTIFKDKTLFKQGDADTKTYNNL